MGWTCAEERVEIRTLEMELPGKRERRESPVKIYGWSEEGHGDSWSNRGRR